ncbi:MAG: DUF6377 domain-containing protein [Candidatus Cryptobacteroides sp.]
MKQTLAVILLAFAASVCAAQSLSPGNKALLDSLVVRFDSLDVYQTRKLEKIQSAKDRAGSLQHPAGLFQAYLDVATEYRYFDSDSTIAYIEKARDLAWRSGDREAWTRAGIQSARMLIVVGYYQEAIDRLGEIDRRDISKSILGEYYEAKSLLYYELFHFDGSRLEFRDKYEEVYKSYLDSVEMTVPADSEYGLRAKEKKAYYAGDFETAMESSEKRMAIAAKGTIAESFVWFERSLIYRDLVDSIDDSITCLLRAAIIDLENSNQDVAAFTLLVSVLRDVVDVGILDKMSKYSYDTMLKFRSRTRRLIGTDMVIETDEILRQQLVRQKRQLSWTLGMLSVLSVILVAMLCYLWVLIRKGRIMNRRLEQSNHISNSYIASFFELYSSYIDRLISFRSRVNTSLRRGNTAYVIELTNPSRDITNDELKHMYDRFDTAFLDIFPTFVEDINSMLKPECRFEVRDPRKLNTELRIFAIIKLGVTDSARISELLHYSIKTVYNKRSGINSKLAVSREKFEKFFSEI